jgi:hypothetical protein
VTPTSIRECAEAISLALADPGFTRLAETLARRMTAERIAGFLHQVTETPASVRPLRSLKSDLVSSGHSIEGGQLERLLLLRAGLEMLPALPSLRVGPDVEALLLDEFTFYAQAPPDKWPAFEAGTATFVAMSKIATGRRFPGGQFDWEVSGIRRSDLIAVSWSRLFPTLAFAGLKMRALKPVFFSHLSWRRPQRSLNEEEANRSYYRMAQAMARQPEIAGFAACSWFRSPATHRVSPHLAWLSRVFVENGGYVVEAGRADPQSGVLHRSRTRRELFEQGKFRPTRGLVMWPRAAMLAWAAAHPELGRIPSGAPAAPVQEGEG